MPRFFIPAGDRPPADGGQVRITGPDGVHIRRSLRMREGETLFLCDGEGTDYFCELAGFEGEGVLFRVLYHTPTALEPDTAVTLYQGLPKGEKMDWILQKAVELGAGEIVPVVTARSIVRLKPGEGEKKRERWQRIAAEAAGQCGRGRIPLVSQPLPFAEAAARLAGEPALVFYEGGGRPLGELVGRDCRRLSIVVGPEGGFEKEEVTRLLRNGAEAATLGKRILRCETAPLAALSVIMHLTGNLE